MQFLHHFAMDTAYIAPRETESRTLYNSCIYKTEQPPRSDGRGFWNVRFDTGLIPSGQQYGGTVI
jgi:hypothetical protein